VVSVQALPPRADLRAAMQAERDRRAAAGWHVEDIPRNCAFCFCDRQNEPVCVGVSASSRGSAGAPRW
jgi:hypothetical protein